MNNSHGDRFTPLSSCALPLSITVLHVHAYRSQTEAMAETVLHIVCSVRERINIKDGYWTSLLAKISADHPGRHMTEADEDDVISVCKLLGAMICCQVRSCACVCVCVFGCLGVSVVGLSGCVVCDWEQMFGRRSCSRKA